MEDVDYAKLIKLVEKSTKNSYRAYYSNGKIVPNVANLGAKIGEIAKLERAGEYYGIAVEFMENTKPLLTDRFVTKILTMLKKEEYVTPLALLGLSNIDQLIYILDTWLQKAVDGYQSVFSDVKKYPVFDEWIYSVTHDPILTKIKVVDIGYNQVTGNSVLPVDWIGKTFDSGYLMHHSMNKLETRIGKPPVTYAVIYSMIIQRNDKLINNIKNINYQNIFYIDLIDDQIKSSMEKKIRKNYQYVKYQQTLIGFKLEDILEPKQIDSDKTMLKEVGLLVSRLQKSIRRGRYGSKALMETIDSINVSPNYNLPEHNFLRVSSAKQLVWRLFITILEDCRPYLPNYELSLLDLILLALITQKIQEYKFTPKVLQLIKLTAILAQYNDTSNDIYPWESFPMAKSIKLTNSDFHNALVLALDNIIMMNSDNYMLQKYYSEKKEFKPFIIPPELSKRKWKSLLTGKKYLLHKEEVYQDIVLSSMDMHTNPYIILYYQACIPVSMTTKEISNYIWDISSSYNVRSGETQPKIDKILRTIQSYLLGEKKIRQSFDISGAKLPKIQKVEPNDNVKRNSFLVLFGTKYKSGKREVIIAGTKELPARVKVENEWTYSNDSNILNAYPKKIINLTNIDPPLGYQWTKSSVKTEIIKGIPRIDGNEINYFDGTDIIKSVTPNVQIFVKNELYKFIISLFSGVDVKFSIILKLRNNCAHELRNWKPKNADLPKLNMNLIKLAYTKIFNQFNNIIMIGPVTRTGNKMQNSINYMLEGKLWAVFNLFSYLYPQTFRPNGALNFYMNSRTSGYVHLIKTLESILFVPRKIKKSIIPTIQTELWDHQKETASKIVAKFEQGYHGFGDASDVGAGKTLTSIKIAIELIKQDDNIYSGILVMLPGNKLIATWQTELDKHTIGFDIKIQKNTSDIGPIQRNTIVITTMGRMRDHPIDHLWLLVIIDECLTVQNKNALWTEEAWKQSVTAKHLVMMSATFFRTRFDKLYYMLKMLKTGLPERKEYLDTILLESIVSQVSKIKRKWTSNFHYFHLSKKSKQIYQEIAKSEMGTEIKFSKLSSILISDPNIKNTVAKQLGLLIKSLGDRRCVIYARSTEEVKLWSKKLVIPIYPTKGHHCLVTYSDGTYGLNDLVIYDTIVMRPPPPDKLPQIKGRLDRPGNKNEHLHIEYFVLKDTIEEGLILRLNIASQFIHRYIMPLAKFYDISVNYQKYLAETNDDDNKK